MILSLLHAPKGVFMYARFFIIILLIPFCCFASDKQKSLKKKMMADLDIIKNAFEVKYAPKEWKKTYCGWDLNEQINAAKAKIKAKENITVKDYQKILREFFFSCCDIHVGIYFHSTEVAKLPFQVRGAQGRYFISWVHEKMPFPISVGDEVISFDGRPIHEVIEELKNSLRFPNTKTHQGYTEILLTLRYGQMVDKVPKGQILIGIKHSQPKQIIIPSSDNKAPNITLNIQKDQLESYPFEWDYKPEAISAGPYRSMYRAPKRPDMPSHNFNDRNMLSPLYERMCSALKRYENQSDDEYEHPTLGCKKSGLPPLGEVVWETVEKFNFHAYLFRTQDKRVVGYIRIPSFEPGNNAERKIGDLADLINLFEMTSDALIIDLIDNPGGQAIYTYAVASLCSKTPLRVYLERQTITTDDVHHAYAKLNNENPSIDFISGYPVDAKFFEEEKKHNRFIIDQWNQGHTLTDSSYNFGISVLKPHPWANCTKPIMVLVNHMDISAADFFPAILQDNKRATIFGSRTAGAGGYIVRESHQNLFGINFYSLTGSIAERFDKKPIENLGVTPDVPYEVTPDDLQNNYQGYLQAVNDALKELLKNTPTDPHRPEITNPTHPTFIPGKAK